jgi:flagellar basal body P-ring protein FlgI
MKRAGLILSLVLAQLVGCSTEQFRLQSSDDEKADKPVEVKTVGSVTSVWGVQPVRVYGVGIVHSLAANGGGGKPGPLRQQAIRHLKEMGCKDPVAFLAQPDVAVVRVTAQLTPGTQKGEPVDIDVEVDPSDPVPSLRGGILLPCELSEYADKQQLRGGKGNSGDLKGHALVKAEGPLLVGLAEIGDKNREKRGRIWGGGKALIDRNFGIILNKESKDARTAKLVSDRVNERFFGPFRGTMRGMAEAKSDTLVTLRIPHQYKNNWPRYLRVIRQLPLRETESKRNRYARQLGEELQDPAKTVVAALKLEALGTDAVGTLQKGLAHESPLVRFTSAEALAYLGEPCCAEPLAQLIEQDERLRAYGLTALASLDESACHVQLRKLLGSASAETRYGAFRALRTLDDRDQAIPSMSINDFHLHRAAADASPLVHVSTNRRAELVLFGDDHKLLPPFAIQVGQDFVITAREGDSGCKLARLSTRSSPVKEDCSLQVDEVIRKLGALGASYADVVELLQKAHQQQSLSCRVVVDAVPQAPSVYALVNQGANDKFEPDVEEDADNAVDLGMTPNLFSQPNKRHKPRPDHARADD